MAIRDRIEEVRVHFGADMTPEKAEQVIDVWRGLAQSNVADDTVEVAAPFQRHFFARGTGLPSGFLLALTPDRVVAFEFDPRGNANHPIGVSATQLKKQVGEWPRSDLRVADVQQGKMTINVAFELHSDGERKTIPARTPRLAINPQAAVVIRELGGELPAPS